MLRIFPLLVALMMVAAPAFAEEAAPAKSKKEDVSYSLGMKIGQDIKDQELDLDADSLAAGIKDTLSGGKAKFTAEQQQQILMQYQQELRAQAEVKAKATADKNKAEGDKFLADNKKKKDVVTLPSGLQYKILTKGTGPKPKATDTVSVQYKGTLLNGTEFDSSYKRGEAATFPVNGVIPGWVEALQLMPVGSKWQLFIPPGLAYGERGAGPAISPNSTLIFEVELVSIKQDEPKKDEPAKP